MNSVFRPFICEGNTLLFLDCRAQAERCERLLQDALDHNEALEKRIKEEGLTCVICAERRAHVMCLECRHLCLCAICAAHLMQMSGVGNMARCPICREFVQATVSVYLP